MDGEGLNEPLIEEPIGEVGRPKVAPFKAKLAKATIDTLFVRRWMNLMKYSGTAVPSYQFFFLIFAIAFGFGAAYLEVAGLSWNAGMMGLMSRLAPSNCVANNKTIITCPTTPLNSTNFDPFELKPTYPQIWQQFTVGVFIFLGMGLCHAGGNAMRLLLWWFWRKHITTKITEKYLRGSNPFAVIYLREYALDNPDQRIAADIDGIAELSAKVIVVGSFQIAMLIFSSQRLYERLDDGRPVAVAWGMAIGFAILYYFFITPISKYVFKLDHKEGDFRYAHARIREFAESIAFYEGEKMEQSNSETAFDGVIKSSLLVAKWTSFFNVYSMLNIFLPYYILVVVNATFIWPKPLSTSELGTTLVASSSLASAITGAVSIFLSLSGDLGKLAGFVGRVGQLQELFYYLNSQPHLREPVFNYESDVLEFKNVTCLSPQKNTLVTNLNMRVDPGNNVLILGPSGCGKSSLLRALVGLWYCDGTISKPRGIGSGGIFYLPQKPYFRHGTLRENLIYPEEATSMDDTALYKCLEMANIEYIHQQRGGWDKVQKWAEILSPGEQQRLVFARLFFHQPKYAVLDESTAALDSKNERVMYETCQKLGITYLSVGHRTTLHQFHKTALKFDGKGGYTVEPVRILPDPDDDGSVWAETENHPGTLSLTTPSADQKNGTAEQNAEKALKRGYLRSLFFIWRIMHKDVFGIPSLIAFFLVITGFGAAFMFAYSPQVVGNVSRVVTAKASDEFPLVAVYVIAFHAGLGILIAISRSCAMFLGIYYRKNLTEAVHKDYFNSYTILNLNTVRREIDNVDQRIASDIGLGTSGFIEVQGGNGVSAGAPIIGSAVGNGVPSIIYFLVFNVVAVIIQFYFVVTTNLGGWVTFGIILAIIIVIGGVSLIFTYFISKFTMLKSKAEGDFRHAHVHVREYAESIGFHGRHSVIVERKILTHFFDKVLLSWKKLLTAIALFGLVREIMMAICYALAVMTVVIYFETHPTYADRLVQSRLFSSINSMIRTARYSIGWGVIMVGIFSLVGSNQGFTLRIATLLEAIMQIKHDPRNKKNKNSLDDTTIDIDETKPKEGERVTADYVGFSDVYCQTPTGRILNSVGVTTEIRAGDRMLLMGPSGCGKSSLLRVLSGLWSHKQGRVTYPGKQNIMFLPQKAYMVLGTFRDQIIYPETYGPNTRPDDELEKFLKIANLEYLLKRFPWDSVEIWNAVLSPGEQQRLSFARLFYHAPKFAVLDESTSALDPYNEDEMYTMCTKLGLGVISVGHRESLILHHNYILKFDGKGGWNLNKKSTGTARGRRMTLLEVGDVRQSIAIQPTRASEAAEEFLKKRETLEPLDSFRKLEEDEEEESF